jgi:hypothetical protein
VRAASSLAVWGWTLELPALSLAVMCSARVSAWDEATANSMTHASLP